MTADESIDPRINVSELLLRPEEKLLSARIIEAEEPKHLLPAAEALQYLARVNRPEDIGKHGPLVAALDFPEHEQVPEHRRYEVVFGRDSLISARLVFDQFPLLTRVTVKRLAELQGVQTEAASEEEPGKIVHEARPEDDPIAPELIEGRGWKLPYYGTLDATPLFITAVARYALRHDQLFLQETFIGRDGRERTIEESALAALRWLKKKLDHSPNGILEARRMNTKGGLIGQSWKDSADAHHHSDGSLVDFNAIISSIDVQAKAFDALHDAAKLFPKYAHELHRHAEKIRSTVLTKFWVEDRRGGYFALGSERGSGGHAQLLQVRTSNMGHLLNSRILQGEDCAEQREEMVKTLLSPEMLSRAGIRTLAANENRYRPYSYHNGSVWPWDTCWISLGLWQHGYHEQAQDLWKRIGDIIKTTKRFPEFVSGADDQPLIANRLIKVYDTKYNFENKIEQPPQEIQAWTVASVLAIEHLEQQYGSLPR